MDYNELFFYQNYILLIMIAGGIGLLYYLVNSTNKRWFAGGLALVCAAVTVWYFIPFHMPLDTEGAGEFPPWATVDFGETRVTEMSGEQVRELTRLCNELVYTRQVGEKGSGFFSGEYVYLNVSDGATRLSIYLALNEGGFSQYPGVYGFNDRHDHIKNPEELTAYVMSLRALARPD